MLYLLDASVLITAHNLYYPIDAVPEYWEWLVHVGNQGLVKMPFEIFDEVTDGPNGEKDPLFAWLQQDATRDALLLPDIVEPAVVQLVIVDGYAPDLTDDQIDQIGRDPFLIAYALSGPERCVVTVETSEPKKQRQNRKIPDVCKSIGVACCNPFELNRTLGFRTNWKQNI
jgi:hypothetical protein